MQKQQQQQQLAKKNLGYTILMEAGGRPGPRKSLDGFGAGIGIKTVSFWNFIYCVLNPTRFSIFSPHLNPLTLQCANKRTKLCVPRDIRILFLCLFFVCIFSTISNITRSHPMRSCQFYRVLSLSLALSVPRLFSRTGPQRENPRPAEPTPTPPSIATSTCSAGPNDNGGPRGSRLDSCSEAQKRQNGEKITPRGRPVCVHLYTQMRAYSCHKHCAPKKKKKQCWQGCQKCKCVP